MTELPNGWALTTVGEAMSVAYGKSLEQGLRTDDGEYRYVGSGGPIAATDKRLTTGETIVVGRKGTAGSVQRFPHGCWPSDTTFFVEVPGGLNAALIEHQLRSAQLAQHDRSTALPGLGRPDLESTSLVVPPLAEQERIVTAIEEAFSRLDAGEAGLRTVRQLLKRMREAILTAAITGRLLGDESVPTVNHAVGGDGKQPAQVPGDWRTARLEDLAQFITDGDHRPPKRVAAGVPHLTAKNVRNGRLDLSGCSFVDEAGFNQTRARYEPLQDDVIVTCVGTIGRVAVVPPGLAFSADRNLAAVRLRSDILPKFVRVALESPGLQRRMRESSGSTAQPHLYLKDLRSITVPVPPIEEQARIVAEVERQLSFVEACERAVDVGLARAAGLRRSVLKAAFEGRLVPQDPSDEPATVLLERIRVERAAHPVAKRRARQTA